MANNSDLGQQLSLAGSAITTAYQAGTTFYAGAANGLALFLKVVTDPASALTSVTIKLQGSYDGTLWYDLPLVSQLTSATTVDTAFTVAANNGAGVVFAAETSSNRYAMKGLRVMAKANAGGSGADAVTVNVGAW